MFLRTCLHLCMVHSTYIHVGKWNTKCTYCTHEVEELVKDCLKWQCSPVKTLKTHILSHLKILVRSKTVTLLPFWSLGRTERTLGYCFRTPVCSFSEKCLFTTLGTYHSTLMTLWSLHFLSDVIRLEKYVQHSKLAQQPLQIIHTNCHCFIYILREKMQTQKKLCPYTVNIIQWYYTRESPCLTRTQLSVCAVSWQTVLWSIAVCTV